MPTRRVPLVNESIYHVVNRTIDSKKVFSSRRNCERFFQLSSYYRSSKATIGFSKLERLNLEIKKEVLKQIPYKKYFKINILAFCFMPTHFHFLLKQNKENGISEFIANITNAFTRYFNIKSERKGPIFLPRFRAERIKSDSQLIHVSRYIHLNPFSGDLVKNFRALVEFFWSSYQEYVTDTKHLLSDDRETILSLFDYQRRRYQDFVEDQADYQRSLEELKYLKQW